MKLGKRIYSNISEDELYKIAVQVINSKEIAEGVEDIKLKMEKTNADIDVADIVDNYINSLKNK